MSKLIVFNNVTLDGYFCDAHNDMSWAHSEDAEWSEFVTNNSKGTGAMLFGRKTYEMMASFWPTPDAIKMMPDVAKFMNEMPKYTFSKTLKKADWSNTLLHKDDLAGEVNKLKKAGGPDIIIFGSGSIVAQLADANLIDEYQIVVHPILLGSGRSQFEGMKNKLKLKLKSSRTFKNSNVFLVYAPT